MVKLDRANNHWKQPQFKRECIFTNKHVEYNMLRLSRIDMLCIKHMEFKLDRRRVNRTIGSIYPPFTGPIYMCVNKLYVTAASPIVKIEVTQLRVSKTLLLTNKIK